MHKVPYILYINRAEALKKKLSPTTPTPTPVSQPTNKPVDSSGKVVPPLGFGAFADSDDEGSPAPPPARGPSQRGPATGAAVNLGPGGYSKEEIDVIR